MITEKACTCCGEVKPLSEFNADSRNKQHGKRAECKACTRIRRKTEPSAQPLEKRRYKLLKNFGLTLEAWDKLFESQDCKCAICGTTDSGGTGWHTDHSHVTGKVRGILCSSCNRALGYFKDNIDILNSASAYLQKH